MAGGFNPDEYNTVAERIEAFIAKYPDGSLQSDVIELSDKRVVMRGYAYRTPDDAHPGIGHSAMPIPATNSMLRNSEIETAETSAWGRAIAALGFEVRKAVATKDEVDNKKVTATADGGLIGTAEVGKARDSDFETRQTPDGFALGFKLKSNGGGFKVLTRDELALQLADAKDKVVGQRVTVFGRVRDQTDRIKGRDITYQIIDAERVQTPVGLLPVTPLRDPEDEAVTPVPGQESFDLAASQALDAEEAAKT